MNAEPVHWTELVRALWPVLALVGGLILTSVMLALTTRFATVVALKGLDFRVSKLEEFRTAQEATLSVLPTRQQLGEAIGELGERVAGLESKMEGVGGQLNTTNTYLHTLIERGLRR